MYLKLWKEQLKQLISLNRIGELIHIIQSRVNNEDTFDETVHLLSRLNDLENISLLSNQEGVIPSNVDLNKVKMNILYIIKNIQENDVNLTEDDYLADAKIMYSILSCSLSYRLENLLGRLSEIIKDWYNEIVKKAIELITTDDEAKFIKLLTKYSFETNFIFDVISLRALILTNFTPSKELINSIDEFIFEATGYNPSLTAVPECNINYLLKRDREAMEAKLRNLSNIAQRINSEIFDILFKNNSIVFPFDMKARK